VDPSYLAKGSYRLVGKDGETVDPLTVDWPASTANGFPYQIIQDPGPNNSLGLVKFMLPNKHSVYLHDTPGRESFKSSNRTFSSGCIRVDRPFELVRLLLADQPEWSDSRIEAMLGSGETTTIRLKQPLPVLLLYWTVDPDTSGDVRFYRDIYQRDAAVLKALDDGFES
jgi:murein L,D-transpeptidase YcbB/YkuD